jgi:hypothetical protein
MLVSDVATINFSQLTAKHVGQGTRAGSAYEGCEDGAK